MNHKKLGPQKFFLEVLALLDVRHCFNLQYCAISRKTNDQTLRKWQKSQFRTQFGDPKILSMGFNSILVVRQCSKTSSYAICRKNIEANLKNSKKTNLGPDFDPDLGPQIFLAGFTFTSS